MTKRSLFALSVLLVVCTTAQAADLVNINTADSTTLQTLNGIGPSKAQAIIDYRTQNGSFSSIEEIMNVSGIGTATYNNIKDFITVGGGNSQPAGSSQSSSSSGTASSTPQDTSLSSGAVPSLSVAIVAQPAIVGAGTVFEGMTHSSAGAPLMVGVRYVWNFGDGATAEGQRVMHTYAYPGTYEAVLSAAYNYTSGTARLVLDAAPADVSLLAEGDGSLTIGNLSSKELDVGRWVLAQGTSTFVIPEDTIVLGGKGVRFSPAVLGFMGDMQSSLFYPNGTRAAGAGAGARSPLRGQVVDLPKVASSAASAKTPVPKAETQKGTLAPAQDEAAAVALGASATLWSYLLGLAAVIALGAIGAYYARMPKAAAETDITADEFEIE